MNAEVTAAVTENTAAAVPATPDNSALVAKIKAQFNNLVDVKEAKFHFKSVKLTAKMPDGTEKETGETYKRPTVDLQVPVLSMEGLIAILEGGDKKQQDLVLESLSDVVFARAREIINDDEKITQDSFPLDQLGWAAIANLPKAERRGAGIAKEIWDEFGADYVAVMPAVTGKTADQVGNAVKIYLTKFNSVKTNKPVLSKLKDQLGLYLANSPKAEQFTDCVEFLVNKSEALLNVDESKLLENL